MIINLSGTAKTVFNRGKNIEKKTCHLELAAADSIIDPAPKPAADEDAMDDFSRMRWLNAAITAQADAEPCAEASAYLDELRVELGLSRREAGEIMKMADGGESSLVCEGSPAQERMVLRDMVCVAVCGGKPSEKQLKLIREVACCVGLSVEELDELLDICRDWVTRRLAGYDPGGDN